MRLLRALYDKGAEAVLAVLMAVMVVAIFLQVVMRYVFNQPLAWSEELARFAMIWVTFAGAFVAFKRKRHISVDSLVSLLKPGARRVLRFVVDLMVLLFAVVMLWYGYEAMTVTFGQEAPGLGIPMWTVYVSVPLGGLLVLIYALVRVLQLGKEASSHDR